MDRHCKKCDTVKPLVDFRKDISSKHGYGYQCKECTRLYTKMYDASSAGRGRTRKAGWSRQGIDITLEAYEAKYEALDGCCEVCNVQLDVLCVDHCHDTGEIRGLLCRKCNLSLEGFLESRRVLNNAIAYLNKYEVNKE